MVFDFTSGCNDENTNDFPQGEVKHEPFAIIDIFILKTRHNDKRCSPLSRRSSDRQSEIGSHNSGSILLSQPSV